MIPLKQSTNLSAIIEEAQAIYEDSVKYPQLALPKKQRERLSQLIHWLRLLRGGVDD